MSDVLGRADTIRSMLLWANVGPEEMAKLSAVEITLERLLREQQSLITLQPRPAATVVALVQSSGASSSLVDCHTAWAPFHGPPYCKCGRPLHRWRCCPAVFFILSSGVLHGSTVFLRCFLCQIVMVARGGGMMFWRRPSSRMVCISPDLLLRSSTAGGAFMPRHKFVGRDPCCAFYRDA